MIGRTKKFNLLEFLANKGKDNGNQDGIRIPSLKELSKSSGVSIASLREQLEIAKTLGLVRVRPKVGIQKLPYSFGPAVSQSLNYALMVDRKHFEDFADLRRHVEADYWHIAVELLTIEDKNELKEILANAQAKLELSIPEIPHEEHRELHLVIFRRINNPFVTGILEAYWDAYESIGLGIIKEFDYLKNVWKYHEKIVNAICSNQFDLGYKEFLEHMDMIQLHPQLKYIVNSKNRRDNV